MQPRKQLPLEPHGLGIYLPFPPELQKVRQHPEHLEFHQPGRYRGPQSKHLPDQLIANAFWLAQELLQLLQVNMKSYRYVLPGTG